MQLTRADTRGTNASAAAPGHAVLGKGAFFFGQRAHLADQQLPGDRPRGHTIAGRVSQGDSRRADLL